MDLNFETEKIEHAINSKIKKSKDKEVNLKVSISEQNLKPLNPFVILFYDNFQEIIKKFKLNTTEILIILELLKLMSYGNLIKTSQSEIAKKLEIPRQNVNRAFNKFRNSGLIIKTNESSEFLNPQIISKGKLWDFKKEEIYKKSIEIIQNNDLKKSF